MTLYDGHPFSVDGVSVQRVGQVKAYYARYVDMFRPGTVSMFERGILRACSKLSSDFRALRTFVPNFSVISQIS